MRKKSETKMLTIQEAAVRAILASDMSTLTREDVLQVIGPGLISDVIKACERKDGSVLSITGTTRDDLNMAMLLVSAYLACGIPDSLMFLGLRGSP